MKKFVIFVKQNKHVLSGYFKSSYFFQGELFFATETKPESARLFDTEKAAARFLNSKGFAYSHLGVVEEAEVSESDLPKKVNCTECSHLEKSRCQCLHLGRCLARRKKFIDQRFCFCGKFQQKGEKQ